MENVLAIFFLFLSSSDIDFYPVHIEMKHSSIWNNDVIPLDFWTVQSYSLFVNAGELCVFHQRHLFEDGLTSYSTDMYESEQRVWTRRMQKERLWNAWKIPLELTIRRLLHRTYIGDAPYLPSSFNVAAFTWSM